MANDNWDANLPEPEVDFSFDSDGVDPSKVGSTITVDLPGKYHLEIGKVREDFDTQDDKGGLKSATLNIPCHVVHSVPGQSPEGTIHYQRLILSGKGGGAPEPWMVQVSVAFLAGIGLLKEIDGKFIDPETKSTRINVKTLKARLERWQFIGWLKLVKGTKKNKSDPDENAERYPDSIEFPFGRGAFPIDDEQVRNVPKNLDCLKLIGKENCMPPVVPAKGTGAKAATAPAKASPTAKPDSTAAPAHTPSAPPTTVASTTPTSGGSAFPPVPAGNAVDGSDLDDL